MTFMLNGSIGEMFYSFYMYVLHNCQLLNDNCFQVDPVVFQVDSVVFLLGACVTLFYYIFSSLQMLTTVVVLYSGRAVGIITFPRFTSSTFMEVICMLCTSGTWGTQ